MPVQHTFQPLPDLRYRLVHTTAQRLLDLLQFRLQSLPRRLSSDLKAALPGGIAAMRHPQERETLRLPFPPHPALSCGVWSELDQPRLLRMQFQPELRQPFPKLLQYHLGLVAALKPPHQRARLANAHPLALPRLSPPYLDPQIEN